MSATGTGFAEVLLDSMIPNLEAEGYEVFLQPPRWLLPTFMQDYRPHAIALKQGAKVAIEVLSEPATGEQRMARVAELFAGHPEWELRIVYAPPHRWQPPLEPSSQDAVDKVLDALSRVEADAGGAAALVAAWSALEATARTVLPVGLERAQSAAQLTERLAADGYVTPDEADDLRRIGRLRNRAAHGDLTVSIPPEEIAMLARTVRMLRGLAPAATGGSAQPNPDGADRA